MKSFTMNADIRFSAKNITDAFRKLEKHFRLLKKGEDNDLIELGKMQIEPITPGQITVTKLSQSKMTHLEYPIHIPNGCQLTVKHEFYNDTGCLFVLTDVEIHGKSVMKNGDVLTSEGLLKMDLGG
jgi:hypothetical protein